MTANGIAFAYAEEGTGPLVLMMHGFPDTHHTWDHARPVVAQAGFRVVTPNMRGYAPTGLAPDGRYDVDALGEDVLALISALGEKSAIVVGHDWGAAAAYAAAAVGGPEKVSKLITLGIPHPASVRPTPSIAWKARHFVTLRLPGAVTRTAANDCATIDVLVKRWSPAWAVPPDETRAVKTAFAQPGSLDAALGYYRQAHRVPKAFRNKISVPTFTFAGLNDVIEPDVYEPARRFFTQGYEVLTMPGGHFMHREHPAVFGPLLLKAITSAPLSGR